MTYGAKVTINEYFTGNAEVRCDYYYYWYDRNGYMHTNNATTYYTISCYPVTLTTNPTSMSLNVGEAQTISYSYSPSNVSPKPTIRFFSSNTNVATVSQEGRVKAVGSGNATITISNSSGPDEKCSVNVKSQQPTGISLPGNLSLIVGESKTINPTIYPSGAQCSLTWTSSDVSVATVSSSGNVTAKKAGRTCITAKINGYNYYDDCYVTVEKPTLTLKANPSGGMLEKGATVTLTANDNDAEIYYTLNGRTPNLNSTRYNSPIPIDKNLTLKAIAYHSDYKTSSILTANYEVTSLKVTSTTPGNGAKDVERNIIPCVTFNSEIQEGDNFPNIKLFKNGVEVNLEDKIISNNTLYLIPQEELSTGTYKLAVPQNSIQTSSFEVNFAYEFMFLVKAFEVETIKKIGDGKMLKTNGELYFWGYGVPYVFPDPSMKEIKFPTLIYKDIVDYQHDYPNTYFLRSDGTLMGWGGNYNSSTSSSALAKSCSILGDGTKETRLTPVEILSDIKTICVGSYHSGAIKSDNTLWKWGRSNCGQIGNGKQIKEGQLSPVKVLDNVKDASFGNYHSVALKYDGSMWVWGICPGIGTTAQTTPLKKMTDVAAISSNGTNHVLVLKNDRTVWSFGKNDHGQIGDGTTTDRATPYRVLSDAIFIEATGWQNIAIKEDGSLWRWGFWSNGISTSPNYYWLKPKKILDDVVCAHANSSLCFALKKDGTLWGMGCNNRGSLGNGTTENSTTMIKILDDVAQFWYENGVYAMRADGSLWGWGTSYVGDGSTDPKLSPTKILDGPVVTNLENIGIDVNVNKVENLPVGEKLVLQSVLIPSNCNYDSMNWSIEDENVATISKRGVVTAKAPGKTTIHLEVKVGDKSFGCTCDLVVTEPSGIIDVQRNYVKMSISNSILHLENLNGGEKVSVHTVAGICIYNGVASGCTMNIPLNESGIYIIKAGNQTLKVLNY